MTGDASPVPAQALPRFTAVTTGDPAGDGALELAYDDGAIMVRAYPIQWRRGRRTVAQYEVQCIVRDDRVHGDRARAVDQYLRGRLGVIGHWMGMGTVDRDPASRKPRFTPMGRVARVGAATPDLLAAVRTVADAVFASADWAEWVAERDDDLAKIAAAEARRDAHLAHPDAHLAHPDTAYRGIGLRVVVDAPDRLAVRCTSLDQNRCSYDQACACVGEAEAVLRDDAPVYDVTASLDAANPYRPQVPRSLGSVRYTGTGFTIAAPTDADGVECETLRAAVDLLFRDAIVAFGAEREAQRRADFDRDLLAVEGLRDVAREVVAVLPEGERP